MASIPIWALSDMISLFSQPSRPRREKIHFIKHFVFFLNLISLWIECFIRVFLLKHSCLYLYFCMGRCMELIKAVIGFLNIQAHSCSNLQVFCSKQFLSQGSHTHMNTPKNPQKQRAGKYFSGHRCGDWVYTIWKFKRKKLVLITAPFPRESYKEMWLDKTMISPEYWRLLDVGYGMLMK